MIATRAITFGLAVIVATGCGDSETNIIEPPSPPAPTIASVTIDQPDVFFGALGSAVNLTATVKDTDGNTLANPALTWAVLKGGVATVSGTGRLVSLANGVDSVRVAADSVFGFIKVDVTQVPVTLQLSAQSLGLTFAGQSSVVTASVIDSNRNAMSSLPITWSSRDSTIAHVTQNGLVTAITSGMVRVSAAAGSFADSMTVTVSLTGPYGGAIRGTGVTCNGGLATAFSCDRIDLVSYLPISALGGRSGIDLTDMWGWTDSLTSRDYALVHRVDGMAFVDVTDPANPRYLGYLPGTTGRPAKVWRDVKTYRNHAFIVGDGSGAYGVQIFDLTDLRGAGMVPQVFSETAHYTGVQASHNIVINEQTGYAYVVGANGGSQTCGSGLHMIDISDPLNPSFAGCFSDPLTGLQGTGYTHDAQCVLYNGPDPDHQGEEVCFGLNETGLSIANVSDKANPVAVSRASYPGVSYAHQGWLSQDSRYLFSNDELDELQGATALSRLIVWDVIDLDDPVVVKEYLGPNSAIDHNAYVKGNVLYQSNYQFGIRAIDITDPANPAEMGFFDTAPGWPDAPGFGGSWTNYPFFDTGVVLVTSAEEGLFVLRLQ